MTERILLMEPADALFGVSFAVSFMAVVLLTLRITFRRAYVRRMRAEGFREWKILRTMDELPILFRNWNRRKL